MTPYDELAQQAAQAFLFGTTPLGQDVTNNAVSALGQLAYSQAAGNGIAGRLFRTGSALAGASPEQIAADQQELGQTADILGKMRGAQTQSPVGNALKQLFPDSAPAKSVTPPVTPPAGTKTPPPSSGGPTGPTAGPVRLVVGPDGRKTWTLGDNSISENGGAYVPTVMAPGSGTLNAPAMQGRGLSAGTPGQGAYSYTGTQGFDPGKQYGAEEFGRLKPQEQAVLMENAAKYNTIATPALAQKEQAIKNQAAQAAADEATDPFGSRQADIEKYLNNSRMKLADPSTLLGMQYKLALNQYRVKFPQATPDQLNQYALMLQQQLVLRDAQQNAGLYGSLIQQYDPRVLIAQARNSLGFGAAMQGLNGGQLPPQQ